MHRLVLTLVLLCTALVVPAPAHAAGTCVHIDVKVYADGVLVADGPRIAVDGGFGHAGTGVTFRFQARTFAAAQDICSLHTTDRLHWEVTSWPCTNHPKPASGGGGLTWSVRVPVDCELVTSPDLFSASLTNGTGSVGGDVYIYSGAPGWALPSRQARGLFGPFATQADPVNSLTGALTVAETDAAAPGLGVPLSVDRAYNSDDPAGGVLGPGWRTSYSDRLTINGTSVVYHAPDGRDIGFTRAGAGPAYTIERGPARYGLFRSGSGYVLTTYEQMRLAFSAAGELTGIRDRNGQGVTVTSAGGRIVAIRNGRRGLRYEYDGDRLSTVTMTAPGAAPRVVRYEYDGGRLTSVTVPGGLIRRYGYDAAGRLSSQTTGDRTKPELLTEYDTGGRVVAQTDGNGHTTKWAWTPGDGALSGTSTLTDPVGGVWKNEYQRGWLVRQTDPTGRKVRYSYDPAGNLTHVLDGQGNGAVRRFDSAGRLASATATAGGTVRQSYSPANDPTGSVDQAGRSAGTRFDARGNPVSASYGGRSSSAGYDARGLVSWVRDPKGRVTRFGYSADGDLIRTVDPAGQVTTYQIDAWGNVLSATSPRGSATKVSYDEAGRVTEITGPSGATVRRGYDGRGRIVSVTDARGGTTRLRYDEVDQLVGVRGPDDSLPEATIVYDDAGRVVKRTDPGGRAVSTAYDSAGRPVAATYGQRTWRFGYDRSGRLVRTTLPSGKSASFTLDGRGLVTQVRYSDKTPPVSFGWDALGRRVSQTDGTGRTTYGYDAFDRLTSVRGPAGAVDYRWDRTGKLASRRAAGHTETYGWDVLDRLSTVQLDGRRVAAYGYNVAAGTTTTRHADGLTEVRHYDPSDRLVSLSGTRGGKSVRAQKLSYDAAGQVVHSDDSVSGPASYAYDPSGRLTGVCYDQCADFIRYGYDGSGNRTWEHRPGHTKWFGYGEGSELVATLDRTLTSLRVQGYQHDADGNISSDGRTTYTWSAAGKPVTSTRDGVQTTYVHAGDGRRVSESSGGKTTRYLWDPLTPQILASSQARYVYGDGLLATSSSGRVNDVLTGPTGSVLASGTVQREFEPYGADRKGLAPATPTPGYAGGLQLPNGNYLFGQREYDPATAAFLSPDQGGSGDSYAYAGGNPISNTDITGAIGTEDLLTTVSQASGYITVGAALVAVGCTILVVCAPAVPFALGVMNVAGIAAGVADGVLSARDCVGKGNCSRLIIDAALIAATSRLPSIRTGIRTSRSPGTVPRMGAVFGGRDAATKNMVRWSERHADPGYYDVIGHGSPDNLSGMSAEELAAKIGPSSGGRNIRLLSCRTGCSTGTFAQDLANELGVRVMAPTTDIGASGSGKSLTVFDGGEWRWFEPN